MAMTKDELEKKIKEIKATYNAQQAREKKKERAIRTREFILVGAEIHSTNKAEFDKLLKLAIQKAKDKKLEANAKKMNKLLND